MAQWEIGIFVGGQVVDRRTISARWIKHALANEFQGVDLKDDQVAALLDRVFDMAGLIPAPESYGDRFGDTIRRVLGRKRGLGRDLTTEEVRAEGTTSVLAEFDAMTDAEVKTKFREEAVKPKVVTR